MLHENAFTRALCLASRDSMTKLRQMNLAKLTSSSVQSLRPVPEVKRKTSKAPRKSVDETTSVAATWRVYQPMKSVPDPSQPMEKQNMTTEMTQQSVALEDGLLVETVLYFLKRYEKSSQILAVY